MRRDKVLRGGGGGLQGNQQLFNLHRPFHPPNCAVRVQRATNQSRSKLSRPFSDKFKTFSFPTFVPRQVSCGQCTANMSRASLCFEAKLELLVEFMSSRNATTFRMLRLERYYQISVIPCSIWRPVRYTSSNPPPFWMTRCLMKCFENSQKSSVFQKRIFNKKFKQQLYRFRISKTWKLAWKKKTSQKNCFQIARLPAAPW